MRKSQLIKIIKEEIQKEYGFSSSRDLNSIFGELGYHGGFDDFIEDNPGAYNALIEWILSIPEFRETLKNSNLEIMGDL